MGTITIRIRKEIPNERAFLLAALKPHTPQQRFHLHMKSKRSLRVANFTCFGIVSDALIYTAIGRLMSICLTPFSSLF